MDLVYRFSGAQLVTRQMWFSRVYLALQQYIVVTLFIIVLNARFRFAFANIRMSRLEPIILNSLVYQRVSGSLQR